MASSNGTTLDIFPFDNPAKYRDFQIIVQSIPFFVDLRFLCQRSAYFQRTFGVNEGTVRTVRLQESYISAADFLELLLVMGADPENMPKSVTHKNCSLLLKWAKEWDVSMVRQLCEHYLERKCRNEAPTLDEAIDLLRVCDNHGLGTDSLRGAIELCVPFGYRELRRKNVHNLISSRVAAALFSATKEQPLSEHQCVGKIGNPSDAALCDVFACYENGNKCVRCNFYVCSFHSGCPCPSEQNNQFAQLAYRHTAKVDEKLLDD